MAWCNGKSCGSNGPDKPAPADGFTVRLADFGLARVDPTALVSDDVAEGGAGPSVFMSKAFGTDAYRAPEVVINAQSRGYVFSSAVDVWSLGCILVEMLRAGGSGGSRGKGAGSVLFPSQKGWVNQIKQVQEKLGIPALSDLKVSRYYA